jgi:hypothetical protein
MAEEAMAVVVSAGAGISDGGETSNAAMTALVTYLMLEADLADERAKRLREQAETLARRFGVSVHVQDEYGEFRNGTYHNLCVVLGSPNNRGSLSLNCNRTLCVTGNRDCHRRDGTLGRKRSSKVQGKEARA